jgi:transaldolase
MSDWDGFSLANTIYDPTLTQVMYPRPHDVVLRDLETGKDLVTIPYTLMKAFGNSIMAL